MRPMVSHVARMIVRFYPAVPWPRNILRTDPDLGFSFPQPLTDTEGSGTVRVGCGAGIGNGTGSVNVYVGSLGAEGESGVIRIGAEGVHARTLSGGRGVGGFVSVYQ